MIFMHKVLINASIMFKMLFFIFQVNPWKEIIREDNQSFPHINERFGHFTKQIGLDMNTSNFGGLRSLRYSMLVDDGNVEKLNVEDPGRFEVSDAQSMLDSL